MNNPYETLGVGKDATEEEIKRAYRKRAQRAHPDKGGKKEDFHDIALAYNILSDPGRRAHYDETGEDKHPRDRKARLATDLAALFMHVVENTPDVEHTDLLKEVRSIVNTALKNAKSEVKSIGGKIRKLEKVLKRLKKKNSQDNPLHGAVNKKLADEKRQRKRTENMIEDGNEMLQMLDDYQYDFEAPTVKAYTPEEVFKFTMFNDPWGKT